MAKIRDISGMRFGRLIAIKRVGADEHRRSLWMCVCDCGKETVATLAALNTGHRTSCGCAISEWRKSGFNKKHGLAFDENGKMTRLYSIWHGMKTRCANRNAAGYRYYGGKGISVCDEWVNDYKAFYEWSMRHGYQDGLTIDRMDGDKDYSPENCRWVTMKEQQNNKCNNRSRRKSA